MSDIAHILSLLALARPLQGISLGELGLTYDTEKKRYKLWLAEARKRGCKIKPIRNRAYEKTEAGLRCGRRNGRKIYHNLRAAVFSALGGPRCKRCGFSDIRALQFDHINGGGSRERRKLSTRNTFKRMLVFPAEYQVLCANCNWIKRVENSESVPKKEI